MVTLQSEKVLRF